MKKYNILNNSIGWLCFVIAAATYLLTLEPTASFWDCPEFILQGYKLEIGHPPGNPIFMLAARFFANFAFGDVTKVAWMVNAMSALLSAGTILLLFWTITHLVRRLIVEDNATEISSVKMLVIFGSGICGALMYAWSDTFWFSAVEGEVYAFSSFCTALVFWLILKWENRAEAPRSDKYLILIAYVIGISIAVHLLNLLCIPAIVLVIYYKRTSRATVKGSLGALLISFVIVALILYGLVPGLIRVAQNFELICVNTLGMSFNNGVLIYGIITAASFIATLICLYHSKVSPTVTKIMFLLSVVLSGILCIGQGIWLPLLLLVLLAVWLFRSKTLPIRVLTLATLSIMVMFVGYSSYALLLIRSSAHTPMNQNAPDNVFALASYLNREQYGDRPLIYGETLNFTPNNEGTAWRSANMYMYRVNGTNSYTPILEEGAAEYAREVKTSADQKDAYKLIGHKEDRKVAPEIKMLLPRMYSGAHVNSYDSWIGGLEGNPITASTIVDDAGNVVNTTSTNKATFAENLRFFFVYQLNHMYWRYFMWNFAGRQNDIQGQGETTHGNWISGIPLLDNMRLGDQSLLPDDLGKGNAGHNVFYMLPLILGIFGFYWQASCGRRGIEQFWVVFFLFFMTGIAIVLYLNQTPDQPRERDYAFAGSFYAFAIWVGMGVAALWHYIRRLNTPRPKDQSVRGFDCEDVYGKHLRSSKRAAIIAGVIGLIVPLQVVSQTWDDHDRSGRYTARDFGMNYLNSLDPDAIIFTYGDNDTFPLWYAQEVEGVRTDVKVVNLSYLTTDWYINQLRRQSYDAKPIDMLMPESVYAYNSTPFFSMMGSDQTPTDALTALGEAYAKKDFDEQYYQVYRFTHPNIIIPANAEAARKAGRITEADSVYDIQLQLTRQGGGIGINHVAALDMIATSAANGWNRPIYFATTVPSENYIGLQPYFSQTGLAYEVTPTIRSAEGGVNADKMYANITQKWKWGGLDKAKSSKDIYLDETVRRMVTSNRSAMFDLVTELAYQGLERRIDTDSIAAAPYVADRLARADTILALQKSKLSENVAPYSIFEINQLCDVYTLLYQLSGDKKYVDAATTLLRNEINRMAQYIRYYQNLDPKLYRLRSSHDKIVEAYFPQLIDQYHVFGGDAIALIEELQNDYKIDVTRYFQTKE